MTINMGPLGLRSSASSTFSRISKDKPPVQPTELPQEAVVGSDLSPVPHRGHGGVHVHVPAQHQRYANAVALPSVAGQIVFNASSMNSAASSKYTLMSKWSVSLAGTPWYAMPVPA
ncbi:hypothetical protein EYF80_037627 [Liparis tanakae]|uniref:Uncharacterized protein n=1 Tax=Liparis tanakae TaxID=230148 RepID=A0A4Z2GFA5_9TELE|nr:hypothetical protein EYF80_037627 [Liparis tanakae]